MVFLDLLLFLLPFPIAYVAMPFALRANGLQISSELHASFRNALVLYAALVLFTGVTGVSVITAFSGPLVFIITALVVWEVWSIHRRHAMSWWLAAGNISLLVAVPLLIRLQLIPNSPMGLLLVWGANASITLAIAIMWLARTPLSERNKGRVLATATYLLCLTITAAALLLFA